MTFTPLLSDHDYEAIESAVVETARGRWFLAEYARRNRQADTTTLLKALERIEAVVRGERAPKPNDTQDQRPAATAATQNGLVEMARAIARTRAEIAAIQPDAARHGKFGEVTAELGSIVQATEAATSDILAAAEQIQEIAWTLREQGFESEVCDLIDAKAADVYTACSFQDLTGQRTRKVIEVLGYLEGRINAMIGDRGLDGVPPQPGHTPSAETPSLDGPARPGRGLDQAGVDRAMRSDAATTPRMVVPRAAAIALDPAPSQPIPRQAMPAQPMPGELAVSERPVAALQRAVAEAAASARSGDTRDEAARLALSRSEAEAFLAMPRAGLGPMAQAMVATSDPLAAINALSDDEKIALFS